MTSSPSDPLVKEIRGISERHPAADPMTLLLISMAVDAQLGKPIDLSLLEVKPKTLAERHEGEAPSLYVIYRNPSDYPDHYIVRRWRLIAFAGVAVPNEMIGGPVDDLEAARNLIPDGCSCLGREPEDDPVIVEVWA